MDTITSNITTAILTAAEVFRIVRDFPRVWFTFSNSNPDVHYEFPVPSEDVYLDFEDGVQTIHTEAESLESYSVSISGDMYRCKFDYLDDVLMNFEATPLTNGSSKCPNISLYVTQCF